jgi:hypothetical protein
LTHDEATVAGNPLSKPSEEKGSGEKLDGVAISMQTQP